MALHSAGILEVLLYHRLSPALQEGSQGLHLDLRKVQSIQNRQWGGVGQSLQLPSLETAS